jgi:hypothetical protein
VATDFTTYQPPGVYIEEDLSSLVNVIGIRPTVVGIVGPSVGYRVNTEAVTLSGTAAASLAHLGIDPASVVVTSSNGTEYVVADDYTVTAGAGADSQIGTKPDNTATIARVSGGDITDGEVVYVSYRYTDADFYAPLAVTDFETVKDAFGPPLDIDTGAIQTVNARIIAQHDGWETLPGSPKRDICWPCIWSPTGEHAQRGQA